MRQAQTASVAIVLALHLSGCFLGTRAFSTDERLPRDVNAIWLDAQQADRQLEVFRRKAYATCGPPQGNPEGGERWTFDRGVLTIDPVAGAFFVTRGGDMIRLARVRNPLKETLYGSYEMTSRPTADYGHERCWLGNVELRVDGTYAYRDSGNFLDRRKDQAANFFMLHPAGRFDVTYLDGFGPTTLLESVRGHQRIAALAFHAPDGAEKTYFIATGPGTDPRELVFEGDPMEFELGMRL